MLLETYTVLFILSIVLFLLGAYVLFMGQGAIAVLGLIVLGLSLLGFIVTAHESLNVEVQECENQILSFNESNDGNDTTVNNAIDCITTYHRYSTMSYLNYAFAIMTFLLMVVGGMGLWGMKHKISYQ